MGSDFAIEESLKHIRKAVLSCIKPKHKIYVKDHTILIHREDALKDGWALVKLSMMISGTDWKPNWYLELYNTPDEYKWKVILWDPRKDT